MTITAKYAGKCSVCGGSFAAGARIEWAKGAGSKHAGCAGQAAKVAPAKKYDHSRTERTYRNRYGWDGVRGSASYYSSGMYDEES